MGLLHATPTLLGFKDTNYGTLRALFADSVSLELYRSRASERYWAFRPVDAFDPARKFTAGEMRCYQSIALAAFFDDVPHVIAVDREGDLFGELRAE